MSKDRYYPGVHFRPPKNWMNDPNGPIYKNGWYHLFFQYNPNADVWGDIHWGHARSRDLLHWELCPVAIAPSKEAGEIHCYSGCAADLGDEVRIFYTSIGEGERGPVDGAQQWSAKSTDPELLTWEKYGTPALAKEINGDVRITMWRDPFIWKEEDTWYLLLGGTHEKKGCIALYQSPDLETWTYCSLFYQSEKFELVECPNILRFGDTYVLLYSPLEAVRYVIGTIDRTTMQFIPQKEGIFDYSIGKKGFYAPNVYLNDPQGRYVVFGCLFEGDRLGSARPRGWAGMQSLPRVVTLEEDELRIEPAAECAALRKGCLCEYTGGKEMRAEGMQLEILMRYQPTESSVLRLVLQGSPQGEEQTVLTLDYRAGEMVLDRADSTIFEDITKEELRAPLSREARPVQLQVFLDHSAIEIFYDRRMTMSARIFPGREDSTGNCVCVSEDVQVLEGRIYELQL